MTRLILIGVFFVLAGACAPARAFTREVFYEAEVSCFIRDELSCLKGDSLEKSNLIIPADELILAENRRAVAIILNLTLGMLGVHRLYLGTKPWVPAVYLFTFGGGFFVLPFIDLVFLISNRDISRFENNPRVLMWLPEGAITSEEN